MQLIVLTLNQSTFLADQVESIGQKTYTVNLDNVKIILWMTEGGTWKERHQYRKKEMKKYTKGIFIWKINRLYYLRL